MLLPVSKTKSADYILKAYKCGIRVFGENKVQELLSKKEVLPKDIKWHFIGKLQTNKVKFIVGEVELIHSLSSLKLLDKIEKECIAKNKTANVLIQINIGEEQSKSGFLVSELESIILEIEKCNFVNVKGLMVIIPKGDENSNRHYFKNVKEIFDNLKDREFKNINMEILSMGMSGDYKIAIEEGSNLIRVGKGIFGERQEV